MPAREGRLNGNGTHGWSSVHYQTAEVKTSDIREGRPNGSGAHGWSSVHYHSAEVKASDICTTNSTQGV